MSRMGQVMDAIQDIAPHGMTCESTKCDGDNAEMTFKCEVTGDTYVIAVRRESSLDEYVSPEECVESGRHLQSCDDDGFCNSCGEQVAE